MKATSKVHRLEPRLNSMVLAGWMKIFTKWLKNFINFSGASQENKVLLLLDGHSTHVKNLEAIKVAQSNGVVMVCFPPHCTHMMQPLDKTYMKPLSDYYSDDLNGWMRDHPDKGVGLRDIYSIFKKAFAKASRMKNAQSGFEATGLYPFNRNIFTEKDFAAASRSETPDLNDPTQCTVVSNASNPTEISNVASTSHLNEQSEVSEGAAHRTPMETLNLEATSSTMNIIHNHSNDINVENAHFESPESHNLNSTITNQLNNLPPVRDLNDNQLNVVDGNSDTIPLVSGEQETELSTLCADLKSKIMKSVEQTIDKNLNIFFHDLPKRLSQDDVTSTSQSKKRKARTKGTASIITSEEYELELVAAKNKKKKNTTTPARKRKALEAVTNTYPLIVNTNAVNQPILTMNQPQMPNGMVAGQNVYQGNFFPNSDYITPDQVMNFLTQSSSEAVELPLVSDNNMEYYIQ